MGDLLPSELACEERPWKSSSPLADFLKSAGVRIACGSGSFVLKNLLPGYASQRGSESEAHGVAGFARRSR